MRQRGAVPRRKTCRNGKRRFPDRESALGALKATSQSTRDRKPLRVYDCPMCHGWHLTSEAFR